MRSVSRLGVGVFAALATLGGNGLAAQQFSVMARFGTNRATMAADIEGESRSLPRTDRAGVWGGLGAIVPVWGPLSVSGELVVEDRGWTAPGGVIEQWFTYLAAPVFARVSTLDAWRLQIVGSFGVVPAWELSCGGTTATATCSIVYVMPMDCDEMRTELQDFGLAFGLGIDIDLGRVRVLPEIRFIRGLTDLSQATEIFFENKHRVTSFSLGIGFEP